MTDRPELRPVDRQALLRAIFAAMVDPATRERHRAAFAAVTRWQTATLGARLNQPEPFDQQLYGSGVRLLAAPPTDPATPFEQYGYDAEGVLRAARLPQLDEEGNLECMREESFLDFPFGTLVYAHEWREPELAQEAFGASLIQSVNGEIVLRIDLSSPAYEHATVSEFTWEGGRPKSATIDRGHRSGDGVWDVQPSRSTSTHIRAEYEGEELVQMVAVEPDHETVCWSRSKVGKETHAGVVRRWKRALLRAIPVLVDEAKPEGGQLHAVGLLYSEEKPYLAAIVPYWEPQGTIAERVGTHDVLTFWNPADALAQGAATLIDQDRDPELREIAGAFRRVRSKPGVTAEAGLERSVLASIASTLNRRRAEWPSTLEVAPEFVAWPVEYELADLAETLDAVIPRKRRRELHALGQLPIDG